MKQIYKKKDKLSIIQYILLKIEELADMGTRSYTIDYPLSDRTLNALRELGFYVQIRNTDTVVCW